MLGFEDKFKWDDEVGLGRSLSKDKGVLVNEVLDFHLDGMQADRDDIVIKFEDSFQRLWFW